jgi:hypothetical protein
MIVKKDNPVKGVTPKTPAKRSSIELKREGDILAQAEL